MSQKLNWIIKKIILYICVAGLSSKTPIGRENYSLISIILSKFSRNVNYYYCCDQQRQQRRLAIMTSKRSKWNNSLGELSIIIHWEISVNHCWKCKKNRVYSFSYFKYGIYKPREVKKSDKETSARVSLSDFFYLPRFMNPIFKIGEMNKLYITCISPQ